MKKGFIIISIIISGTTCMSQSVNYKKSVIDISKIATVSPKDTKPDWMPMLQNLEMPMPGSARYELAQLKKKSAKLYPRKQPHQKSWQSTETLDPVIGRSFPVANTIILPNGDTLIIHIVGGIPNDNTIAISNAGLLITAFNSRIFAYNTNTDTLNMPIISLHTFSSEFTLNDKYDPKVLYDPIEDRFILVFLNGRLSDENMIIVCFSTTNDPSDPWNLYGLPGNPLSDTTWTDYPAIAITENELFITGNLLRDNEPWQTGFSQTIIWQVDKKTGYDGDTAITTTLWNDIKYDGQNIRNLNPIQGGSTPTGPGIYLLSNKNFTILSDTVFLLEITGEQYDTSAALKITLGKTNIPYGAPPNGRQSHVDSMATNDARVLGGFIENGEIQYVSSTIDTLTGFAGVYHGFINDLDTNPKFTGKILTDDSLDFGYPNIAYIGTHNCSRQSVISMDHTSPERNPGFSTLLYNSNDTYSNLISLKEAESHVDRLNGYERWGDYTGIQRKYNEPGIVWIAGFYGRVNSNFTWVSEVISQVEAPLSAFISDSSNTSNYGIQDGSLTVQVDGGFQPYTIQWDDANSQTNASAGNLGQGLYTVTVKDGGDCVVRDSARVEQPMPESDVFPNPTTDLTYIYFEMEKSNTVTISLYDAKGALAKSLYKDLAKKGSNLFSFSVIPLNAGVYIIRITSSDGEILTKKIIKI